MKRTPHSTLPPILWVLTLLAPSCGQKDPIFRPEAQIILPQGDIVVTASVDGAAISLDGQPTGLFTPGTLLGVPAGGHRVSVYRKCHYPQSDSITVKPGVVHTLHFDVLPIPNTGALAVAAPWPAIIVLDGTPTDSKTPDTLCVPPGDHVVTLDFPGFRSQPPSGRIPADAYGQPRITTYNSSLLLTPTYNYSTSRLQQNTDPNQLPITPSILYT